MAERSISEILQHARTIAVVGLSNNPSKPSYEVAAYLQSAGYRIIPVHPAVREVLGETAYRTLAEIPEKVDIVDVFRRSEAVPEIADAAIAIGAGVLWLQEGVEHEEAAAQARAAGLTVVMNRCLLKAHAAWQAEK
jgi:hypothetical protein